MKRKANLNFLKVINRSFWEDVKHSVSDFLIKKKEEKLLDLKPGLTNEKVTSRIVRSIYRLLIANKIMQGLRFRFRSQELHSSVRLMISNAVVSISKKLFTMKSEGEEKVYRGLTDIFITSIENYLTPKASI